MKILFSVGSFGFLRNFEAALRLLAERGHDLHLVADRKDSVGGTKTLDLLLAAYPDRIRYSYAPSRKDSRWQPLATQLRLTLDYWRYLDRRYDRSPSLRARGASQAPPIAAALTRPGVMRSRAVLATLRRLVRASERAIAPDSRTVAFLKAERPDLLLVTPLLYFGSAQVEYMRAAKALGQSNWNIMRRHILPNSMTPVVTLVPFEMASAIGALTSLDFLGLGVPPGTPSLGELLNQGKNNLDAWWISLSTFGVLVVMLLLLILIGDALRDALDPRKLLEGEQR